MITLPEDNTKQITEHEIFRHVKLSEVLMLSPEFHFQQRCTGIARTGVACPVHSKCMTSSSNKLSVGALVCICSMCTSCDGYGIFGSRFTMRHENHAYDGLRGKSCQQL